ncbi:MULTISPECIES: hypothetical protein [unclassified Nostoc]|nr:MULTISPECIES: hypothetical protein [unclassified Nostoc]
MLWNGIKGDDIAYPVERNGLDLRRNREQLLKARLESNQPS